ncbi:major royal jelly protein 5 [Bradysia coprophila]|uniref:major royal jelly protein 5 n=1 Tax=Bradysia coprophila TaxID=38358 RepID=UPI00187DDA22|nr:major royal jelly protein 5 [Bradysia coprophila]
MFIKQQLSVIIILSYLFWTEAWNLSQLNLNANDYVITDVSNYYIRSFLCIKSRNDSVKLPTLIETIWPENLLLIPPKIFPSDLSHTKSLTDCNGIIQAVGTAVDRTGFLWVIDSGSKYCRPKLLVFDLKKNEEIHRHQFNIRRHAFTSIKIGPSNGFDCAGRPNVQAFITLDSADYLIVYSLYESRWWKLQLITPDNIIVQPKDIAILKNELFVSDECGHLWTAKLDVLNRVKYPHYYAIRVQFIADLLGPSTQLAIDPNGALYYYLPSDGALLRWNSKKPLNAENHDVLDLSPTKVVDIIFGARGSVWIVKESSDYVDDHCKRILLHY